MGNQQDASDALPLFFDGLAAYHRLHRAALSASGPVGFESLVVPPLGTGGDVFFDDNAWLGLALMRHHEINRDETTLALARRLFEFVTSGWSSDQSWSQPGGIRWKKPASNISRNTCSNGPVAQLAVLIHALTEDAAALEWSTRIYGWVRSALLGRDDLYVDQIAPDGTINRAIWSYNQGTMIGAGVLLHRVTGEQTYLVHALATAAASIARFSVPALVKQDAAFNAVFFRNLFMLDRVAPNPAYRELAIAYGDEGWEHARDSSTGLFGGGKSLLNNSAPMIEIYALIAGAPPHA
jgi:hypothetical protein